MLEINGWVEDDPVLIGEDGEWGPFNAACNQADALVRAAQGETPRIPFGAQGEPP